jgi:hypothetical protein
MLERAVYAAILAGQCTHRACSHCLCVAAEGITPPARSFLWWHSLLVSATRKAVRSEQYERFNAAGEHPSLLSVGLRLLTL